MKFVFITLSLFLALNAKADFKVPELTGPVVDSAHVISPSGEQRLSTFIRQLRDTGKAQITILTVSSLEGETIEQASIKVTDKWQLGGKKSDNGILIMLAQKEHKLRIEVGQGLEGDIPDIVAKRIVSDIMSPFFKKGDFDSGFYNGINAIAARIGAPSEAPKYRSPIRTKKIVIMILILVFYLFIMGSQWGSRGRRWYGGSSGYYGGGGWSGSGSGGGWSGGGGGFSGGGASGDW